MDRLIFAVIHSLEKEAHSNISQVRRAPGPLDVSLIQVQSLGQQLSRLVGRDGSTVFWGQFGTNNREGQFPGAVENLTASSDLATFMTLTEVAMAELVAAAGKELLSTGGYVFFMVYEVNATPFLLVAMIKERGALSLSVDMVPTDIQELDLSKLHQAARINLTRYEQALNVGSADVDADEEERTYLCFVNKGARNEVAKYFIDALGCEKGVSSNRATKSAIDAVRKFVSSKKEIKPQARKVRRAVIDHMAALPQGAVITVGTLVAVVRVALGDDLVEHVEGLSEYLNGEDAQVPESFVVSAQYLKSVTRITAQAEGWRLSFEDTEISETEGPLIYNRADKSLRIRRLPDETAKKIEAALDQRG
ncbi:nucleoid-associated protein [Xanthomonas campestris pv. incanae]|uniref:nucleoid-associated protein n=1 Tax=Xanthomonas campestris TaxID=339 RepID=UPI002368176E|nr:nucleoid-associated protein [Xanthomonas campestris]WDJ99155.1 nucleoid-associated protein [Xanthomonas campestris pv. incanae]